VLVLLQYEGDFRPKLDVVRTQLNEVAEQWTREEKDHCLQETEKSFKYSGGLLSSITS
jgi:heme oxygenase